MSLLLRRRALLAPAAYSYEWPLLLVADGVIHYPFTFTKSGSNSSYNTSNGRIVLTTYDNSTSSYSRVRAVSQAAINLSHYKVLNITFNYANNTYGGSIFQFGVGADGDSFEEYAADVRRSAAATGVTLSLDLSSVSGKKHIILYNSTVAASTQQGSRYTITKIWLE